MRAFVLTASLLFGGMTCRAQASAPALKVTPEAITVQVKSGRVKLTVKEDSSSPTLPTGGYEWTIRPAEEYGTLSSLSGSETEYVPPDKLPNTCKTCTATITVSHSGALAPVTAKISFINAPWTGGEYDRVIVGVETTGGASAASSSSYFVDLYWTIPLALKRAYKPNLAEDPENSFGPRLRFFLNPRFTSVPQQQAPDIQTVFSGTLPASFTSLKTNELVQGFSMVGGLSLRLLQTSKKRKIFYFDGQSRTTISAFISGGFTTPLNPSDSTAIFKIPEAGNVMRTRLSHDYGLSEDQLANKTYVAFTKPDRNRFYREYYAGLRFQSHYYDDAGVPTKRAQATFDVAIGQNEAVTRGARYGAVIKADFFYPIPVESARFVYLFGSGIMRMSKATVSDPLVLPPLSDSIPALTSKDVLVLTTPPSNRDFYRVGFGINLVSLWGAIKEKK